MLYLANANIVDFGLEQEGLYFVSDNIKMYLILSADAEGYFVREVDENGKTLGD